MEKVRRQIADALGQPVRQISPLSGGCIGDVYRATLANGEQLVAKVDAQAGAQLELEGYMLAYLRDKSRLPLPAVLYNDPSLLLMEFLPGRSVFPAEAQVHAAHLLADLHSVSGPAFGLERDTLIGSLPQPNPWSNSWLPFFREERLLYMGREATRAGRLPAAILGRLEKLAQRLEDWLAEPAHPSLIHGDVWTGNVLAEGGRITGFLDPAIYYAHPEIELAFTTLFGTFGRPFFDAYQEKRPLAPGFMETRRDLYNLYPLLVHVRLFGGSYVQSVDQTLRRFGF